AACVRPHGGQPEADGLEPGLGGPGSGRRAGPDRRSVRGGQGVAGQLLDHRSDRGTGHRAHRAGRRLLRIPDGGPADHGRTAADVSTPARIEDLLRECAPPVLAALVRRYGQFDACEDALQEALLAAYRQWPDHGVPDHPRAWLRAVADRALVDAWRADSARRRREALVGLDPT